MELVDTDVLIDVQRGHPPAVVWFAGLATLPAVTGLRRHGTDSGRTKASEVRQAMRLVSPFQVVWPTESDCTRAPLDFETYHLSHGLGLLDALIAACAVGLSATLNTFNSKHYRTVPGLNFAQPYTR